MTQSQHPLVGTFQEVFDDYAWRVAGGDVRDNSQFWRRAQIIAVAQHDDAVETATVLFDYNKRVSLGHFINMMNHGEGVVESNA